MNKAGKSYLSFILPPSSLIKFMTPEKWNRVKEIFNDAVELKSEARAEFLDNRINGDAEMREAVEKLLASDADAETMFDNLSFIAPQEFSTKDRIGNYQIVRKIGEGGMGAVYLAERGDLKQKVALKIIRHGADSEVILRRFRREQEILAALEHPFIARLIDVGVSGEGIPYLTMEYVEGEDLMVFCRRKNLSVNEKLILFRKVCEAVSYAHSRLVVHRDLKPSNILVNEKGEPKLLDFGISKLISETESPEADKGTVTSLGMLTPNYASPEQFRGLTVSTSTDVYSLGVVLFELLTDALPYEITGKRPDEVARAVLETEPERPSSAVLRPLSVVSRASAPEDKKLTNENDGQQTKDGEQKTNPKFQILNPKSLRGDLDNIILKSLRKEPQRRYFSVEQFSEDLRRHLEGLPVTARPDTFSYRAEKFIRRNRAAVLASLIVLLTLVGGIAATSWQAVRAERQREIAERQKQETDKRFKQVRELANNIIFKYHDEIANLEGATKVRETLVKDAVNYLDSLAQEAGDDPAFRNELSAAYLRVGDVQGEAFQANLGDTAAAKQSYQKAIDLLEPFAADNQNYETQSRLLDAYGKMREILTRDSPEQAEEIFNKSLALNEKIVIAQPDNVKETIRLANAYTSLSETRPGFAEGYEDFRRALGLLEPLLVREPANVAVIRANTRTLGEYSGNLYMQGYLLTDLKRDDLAAPLYRQAIELSEKAINLAEKARSLAPDDARIPRSLYVYKMNRALSQNELGETDAALKTHLELLEYARQATQKDMENATALLDLSDAEQSIARTYAKRGEFETAFDYFQKSLAVKNDLIKQDPENSDTRRIKFVTEIFYGDAQFLKGDVANAANTYRRAFEEYKKSVAEADSYLTYAEGFAAFKLGSCFQKEAQSQREKAAGASWKTAQESFAKALEFWKKEESKEALYSDVYQEFLNSAENQMNISRERAANLS